MGSIAVASDGRLYVGGSIAGYRDLVQVFASRTDRPGCPLAVGNDYEGATLGRVSRSNELTLGLSVRPDVHACTVTVSARITVRGRRYYAAPTTVRSPVGAPSRSAYGRRKDSSRGR